MKQNIAKTAVFATLGLFLGLMLASGEAKAVTVNAGESVRVDFDLTQLTSYDPEATSRFSGFFSPVSDVSTMKIKFFVNNALIRADSFGCGPGCAGTAFGTFYEYGVFGSGPIYMVFAPILGTFSVDGAVFEQFDFTRESQVPEDGEFVFGTVGEPSAVPLPAALPLLATSVAAMAFVARRRRKAVLPAA